MHPNFFFVFIDIFIKKKVTSSYFLCIKCRPRSLFKICYGTKRAHIQGVIKKRGQICTQNRPFHPVLKKTN